MFSEVGSGKSRKVRTELAKDLDYLNPGDIVASGDWTGSTGTRPT